MACEDTFRRPPAASAVEASIELSRESVADSLLGWLALYVPTWGTSLLLHVAAVLLGAFFLGPAVESPPVFAGPTAGPHLVRPRPPVEVRPKTDRPRTEGRGKLMPGFASITPRLDNPLPDVGDNRLAQLKIIGIGGGGDRLGGFDIGEDTGGIFTPPAQIDDTARKIVYVVDRSGSMTDSLDIVKLELKRSLFDLAAENEFHVIFFSSGPPVEMPTRRLVSATDRNRGLAFEFIDGVIARGETDPSQALERAFAAKPDIVYLLTDGEFDRAVIDLIKRLNVGGKVRVYTIGFLYDGGREILTKIAADNGGEYKFVAEKDLADIVGS
ncbi:MAG: VWA domain-containing protein [Planctomycetes bacterium]|nr:VWA domain-containing protein [Planctomycetota bacterium]